MTLQMSNRHWRESVWQKCLVGSFTCAYIYNNVNFPIQFMLIVRQFMVTNLTLHLKEIQLTFVQIECTIEYTVLYFHLVSNLKHCSRLSFICSISYIILANVPKWNENPCPKSASLCLIPFCTASGQKHHPDLLIHFDIHIHNSAECLGMCTLQQLLCLSICVLVA